MKRRRFFIYLRRRGAARSALLSFFLFTAAVTAGSAETALTASADPVFIRAVLDRVSAYPGQQVTLSYRLYTRKSVTGIQQLEQPPLNGLWVEDIAVDTAPKTEKLSINGRTYHVAVIKKQALFPVAAGKLTIPASVFAVSVRTPGDFPGLSGGEETLHYKTGELSLVVNPLPVAARPADFSNAVGTFSLTASVDRNTLPAGDGVSLQVKLAGHGNLKMMPDIPLPTLSGIAVFPSGRTETTFTSEDAVIGGERTWEYVLVPEAPGLHTIPPLSFSYFNADLKKYETLTTGEISLQVDGVPKGASGETPHADSGFDGARGRNDEPFIDTGETAPAAGYRPISLLRW
ncbi:MAG TPA: BatD family protein, partial [Acidobacteriota bacterium]|nr:BatD family protein [Acidobacteriota bacterium]